MGGVDISIFSVFGVIGWILTLFEERIEFNLSKHFKKKKKISRRPKKRKKIAGPTREVYLNDPREVGIEEALTEIYLPIR